MQAREYVKKINEICNTYDSEGCCNSKCPLKPYNCGIPDSDGFFDVVLKIVKEFKAPFKNYICPRCENEENEPDAKYCKICGLEIKKDG